MEVTLSRRTANARKEEDKLKEEDEDELFREIWERESQQELRFPIPGVGQVVQTQDLAGERWEVQNFSNTVWEAAIWMHYFFQDERCFPQGWLRGRRVLELGAGTGLVGLTLALLGAEVTMTDLPEALPILEHNTSATFVGTAGGSSADSNTGESNVAGEGHDRDLCQRGGDQLPDKALQRPRIQQLCWGNSVEALEVGKAAAAAMCRADGTEEAKWQGFDIIVGTDVIYNEATFPALLSTLSNDHLCSDSTVIYLATKLRGGRHGDFLDQLAENFHVRALESPRHANGLRSRVDAAQDWGEAGCELFEGQHANVAQLPQDTGTGEPNCRTFPPDSVGRIEVDNSDEESKKHGKGGSSGIKACSKKCRTICGGCGSNGVDSSRSFERHAAGSPAGTTAQQREAASHRGGVERAQKWKDTWSYGLNEDLGMVLAFAARRRG